AKVCPSRSSMTPLLDGIPGPRSPMKNSAFFPWYSTYPLVPSGQLGLAASPFCIGRPEAGRPVSPLMPEPSSQKYEAVVLPRYITSSPPSGQAAASPVASGDAGWAGSAIGAGGVGADPSRPGTEPAARGRMLGSSRLTTMTFKGICPVGHALAIRTLDH